MFLVRPIHMGPTVYSCHRMCCHKLAQLCARLWSSCTSLNGISRIAHLDVDLGPQGPDYTAFMVKQSSSLCKLDKAIVCFTASSGADLFLP
jgi:hypothetical protein